MWLQVEADLRLGHEPALAAGAAQSFAYLAPCTNHLEYQRMTMLECFTKYRTELAPNTVTVMQEAGG